MKRIGCSSVNFFSTHGFVVAIAVALVGAGLSPPVEAAGDARASENLELVTSVPLEWEPDLTKPILGPTYMSEAAFRGRLIVAPVQGNHAPFRGPGDHFESGLATFRISASGDRVRQVGSFRCHSTGELSLWGDLVLQGTVRSTEAGNGAPRDRCDRNGLRMIDISDPGDPRTAGFLPLPCGVGDHALVPSGRRIYAYVPSTCDQQTETFTNAGVFGEVSVIRINSQAPDRSRRVGIVDLLPMNGCSEIAVSLVRELAVCTANIDERFGLLDISDRGAPSLIDESVTLAGQSLSTPAFTWDGGHLIMAAESVFGSTKNDLSLVIYDVEDVTNPTEVGTWTVPAGPGEDQLIYSVTAVPMRDGRDVVSVAHANRGFWLVDLTDPSNPRELAHFTPSPEDVAPNLTDLGETYGKSDTIMAYWFNGRFYASDLDRLQVFRIDGFGRRSTRFFRGSYNPQTVRPAFRNSR